jgi:hypothetical protein
MNAAEVCELAGITYRQLNSWTHAGHLTATPLRDGSGTGSLWDYDDQAVTLACRIGQLLRVGFTTAAAVRLAGAWDTDPDADQPNGGVYLGEGLMLDHHPAAGEDTGAFAPAAYHAAVQAARAELKELRNQ